MKLALFPPGYLPVEETAGPVVETVVASVEGLVAVVVFAVAGRAA